ncbi:MAG: DUF547 domain-containing protein [Maribacter sp.]
MNKIPILFVALLFVTVGYSQNKADFFAKADIFFKTYVQDGRFDYKSIKKNPRTLNELVQLAREISVDMGNASEFEAFWINGYNLLVVKGIVENYPMVSPLDISGFYDVTKYIIGGKSITLNDIEHQLLRKDFSKDPRFHFVLVCGGLGCPPIIDEAYMPNRLNAQLNRQTRKALNDSNFIQINNNVVKIPQMFEWYRSDFEHNGKVIDFINRYRSEKLAASTEITHYPHDWNLYDIK